jgi:hypothetical protein
MTRDDPDTVTARLDEACEAVDPATDRWVAETSDRVLRRVAW